MRILYIAFPLTLFITKLISDYADYLKTFQNINIINLLVIFTSNNTESHNLTKSIICHFYFCLIFEKLSTRMATKN